MKHKNAFLLLLVFLLAYIPLFYNLDKSAILIWDEAIYANNALEMAMNKDFLVLHNNGIPNLYNVKPPLVIWLQTLCIWIFGANELAIRLPSALAAFGTCLLVFSFAKRNFNLQTAFFSLLFLLTTQGYVRPHVARTGDLDSVLIFFITAYSLYLFQLLLTPPTSYKKHFPILGALIFAAFLSKSVAGLMPLLGLVLAVFASKKAKEMLISPYLYASSVVVVSLCAGFYALKNTLHKGYFQKVWETEYIRFTENIMPWHEQPFGFYLTNMYERYYSFYLFLLPLSLFLFFSNELKIRLFAKISFLFVISYFLLISYPSVKLDWYDAPLYPILSLLLGVSFYAIGEKIREISGFALWEKSVFIPMTILLFAFPYYTIYQQNLEYLPKDVLEQEGYAIRKLHKTQPQLKTYKVLLKIQYPEHKDQANFYLKKLNYFQNYQLSLVNEVENIQLNDTVLCSQIENIQLLAQKYKIEELCTIHKSKLMVMKHL